MSGSATVAAAVSLLMVLLGACGGRSSPRAPVIACLGDSITYGTTHASPTGSQRDAKGGYPARLARLLGARARVLNRGAGGASAGLWLLDPHQGDGPTLWNVLKRNLDRPPRGSPPAGAPSLALAVLEGDRPDIVVILLGVNDIFHERQQRGDAVVAVTLDRLDRLREQAASVARTVLLATPLPNHRDPPALVNDLARRIRAAHADALPLGERFAAADWERLLSDEVHPNEEGYELLARIVAEELERRGLIATHAS